MFDISKYFDRENLRDCMSELYACGIKGKLYKLLFNLNKDTEISVKTAVGNTEYTEVDECLGQGTNEGAVISAVNLDGGIKRFFDDSKTEVVYHDLKVGPCVFQDDVARLSEDIDSAKDGIERIKEMAEHKLMDFNYDKSVLVLIGSEKFRKSIKQQLEREPIIFCNQPMRLSESAKYLGDYIGYSLSESVFQTVLKRRGLVKRLISEIKVTINDYRSEVMGEKKLV